LGTLGASTLGTHDGRQADRKHREECGDATIRSSAALTAHDPHHVISPQ
jgi:hypothetical protein